jgi:hypothetical protein
MLDPGEYSRTRNNILNRPSGIQKKSCYSIHGVEQLAFELMQLHPENASCIQEGCWYLNKSIQYPEESMLYPKKGTPCLDLCMGCQE